MNGITIESLTGMALPLLFYFAVGTLGAFTKDLYETMTKRIEKIRLGEVLVGGVITTIICYGLADSLFKDYSVNTMFLITFIIGVLGFEIFGNMTNIAKIRSFLLLIDEVRRGVPPSNLGDDPREQPNDTNESEGEDMNSPPIDSNDGTGDSSQQNNDNDPI